MSLQVKIFLCLAAGGLAGLLARLLIGGMEPGRLMGSVIVGALIGGVYGAAPYFFCRAWIRVLPGKHRGGVYVLSKRVTTVGHGGQSGIRLSGDSAIALTHLAIEYLPSQNRHRLRFLGASGASYRPPLVNGQPVTNEKWLEDGDTIQIGKRRLLFSEKATRKNKPPSVAVSDKVREPRPYVGQELSRTADFAPLPTSVTSAEIVPQKSGFSSGTVTPGGLGTRLVCLQGPYAGQSFLLSHAPTTLGRASDRDISLPADMSVSRAHVHIVYQNGCHILANDSSHGTILNGEPVMEPHPLTRGDRIQIGETLLRYE